MSAAAACGAAAVVDAAVVRLPGAVNWYYPGSYQDMPSVAPHAMGVELAAAGSNPAPQD